MKCLYKRMLYLVLIIILPFVNGCNGDLNPADFPEEEQTNLEQQDAIWLTEDEILKTLEDHDINFEEDTALNPQDFMIGDIEPIIYSVYPESLYNCKLFLYLFPTIEDRKSMMGWALDRPVEGGISNEINAKNAYFVFNIPLENRVQLDMEQWVEVGELYTQLRDVVFFELNDGKTVAYEGESEHWTGTFTIQYYEHIVKDETGGLQYDEYHWTNGDVWYKGNDIESLIGEISVECVHVAGTSVFTRIPEDPVDQDGHFDLGSGGSNGALNLEKDVAMTVTWNNQVETFQLQPVTE